MFWLVVTAVWVAMLISPFIMLFIFLPTGNVCPKCESETIRIRSQILRPAYKLVGLRWCLSCGWQGLVRQAPLAAPVAVELVPDEVEEADDDAPWRPR